MTKKEKIIFLCISLVLWVYLCLKAFYVPLIHDEVATFFYYIQTKNFLPFYAHLYANNHVLNSALSVIFYSLFGPSEFVLRMANLLLFIVYIFYCYKISEELKSKIVKLSFIILLLFTHNFIEFFALSRGYAMSAALLLGSIYHLIQTFKNNKLIDIRQSYSLKSNNLKSNNLIKDIRQSDSLKSNSLKSNNLKSNNLIKDYLLSFLFGFLALSANLTLIPSFSIIMGLLVLNFVLNTFTFPKVSNFGKGKIFKLSLITVLFGLAPVYYFTLYLLKLKKNGLLDVGSLNGFWDTTLKSFSAFLTGYHSLVFPYSFIVIFIILILIFIFLYHTKLNLQLFTDTNLIFFILLTGNIVSIFILAKLFKVNYPEDRTAYHLYPLFIGSICFLVDKFIILTDKKLILVLFVPFIFFPLHFFANVNLTHFALYHDVYGETEIPKRYFDKLYSEFRVQSSKPNLRTTNYELITNQVEFPRTIGGYQMRFLCWQYWDYRKDGNMGVLNYLDYPNYDEDYQIVQLKDYLPGWKEYYDSIDYDRVSDLTLLKRRKLQERILVSGSSKETKGNICDEFYDLHSMTADSLRGKVLYIGYKLTINSPAIPLPAWIVVEVRNKKGESIIYERICLDWLKLKYEGQENNFINGVVIHKIPKEADKLLTYFWNTNTNPVSIKGDCFVYKLVH